MDYYEIRKLKIEIQSRQNSLDVYEPRIPKMENKIEQHQEEIRRLQEASDANLDKIIDLLNLMGPEGESYLEAAAPEIMEEVRNRRKEESGSGNCPFPP